MSRKHYPTLALAALVLSLASSARAEVRIEPIAVLPPSAPEPLSTPADGLTAAIATAFAGETRAARATTDVLLLPYFEVEPANPTGVTTLFAVRNERADPVVVRILFLSPVGPDQQLAEEIALPGHAVRSFNLRDQPGLRTDHDGVARGLVVLGVIGAGPDKDFLTGDFFLLRGAADGVRATGGALLNLSINAPGNELCRAWSARFLNGGAFDGATTLTVVADVPGGIAEADPATLIATVYAEDGTEIARFAVKSDSNAFQLPVRALVPAEVPFGSLSLEFPQTRGSVLVEHSAGGGRVVGLKGGCVDGG